MFTFKRFFILLLAVTVGVIVYNIYSVENRPPSTGYSAFLAQLQQNEIRSIHIRGGEIEGTDVHDQPFSTYSPDVSSLVKKLFCLSAGR